MTNLEKKGRLVTLAEGLTRHIHRHPELKAAFERCATAQDRKNIEIEKLIVADAVEAANTAEARQMDAICHQVCDGSIRQTEIEVSVMIAAYGRERTEPPLVRYFRKAQRYDHTRGEGYGDVLEAIGTPILAAAARKAEESPELR